MTEETPNHDAESPVGENPAAVANFLKAILDSEVGQLMEKHPKMGFGEALNIVKKSRQGDVSPKSNPTTTERKK